MPPKRSDRDEDPQEKLDQDHMKKAQGGQLRTLHGEVESELSQARKAERIRARSDALGQVLKSEQVRRMCRRAGIASYATTAPDGEDTVRKALMQVVDLWLFNACFEIQRLAQHLRKNTVSEDLLKEAFSSFDMKLAGACGDRHESCESLKQRRSAANDDDARGAEAEIAHEINNNETCVYFDYAPFVRLLRMYLSEHRSLEHQVKATAGVVSCIQYLLERYLIDILEKARYILRQTTKSKKDTSSPSRKTVFSRDIKTVLTVLTHRGHPILRGRLCPVLDEPESTRSPSRGSPRGSPKAKAKPKAKQEGPARTKTKARAKSGRQVVS